MKDLTNDQVAKIYSSYYGCMVYDEGDYAFDKVIGEVIQRVSVGERFPLLLTPYSKITDYHAIELALIFRPDYQWKIKERHKYYLLMSCADYDMWLWFDDEDSNNTEVVTCDEKYTGEENIEAHGCEAESCDVNGIVDIIDRIREFGYALPYKGQSLFELDIAIDKSLKQ